MSVDEYIAERYPKRIMDGSNVPDATRNSVFVKKVRNCRRNEARVQIHSRSI
jgi:hypothetical protein